MPGTSKPSPESLWQIGDLNARDDGGWIVSADRALGPALGTLVPLAHTADGWRVAVRDKRRVIRLSPVAVDRWTSLGFEPGDADTEFFVCLLRYDHPANRPGATFGVAVARAVAFGEIDFLERPQPPDCAGVDEIDEVLAMLAQAYRDKLEARFIAAPAPALRVSTAASAPQAGDDAAVSFVFGSCQYPAGMMDRRDATRSFEMLDAYLRSAQQLPQAILLVGDQVYTDATYGLLDPARLDDRYRLPYEQLASADGPMSRLSARYKPLLRRVLDDHEILDNWEPWSPKATGERHRRGLKAYWYYQRGQDQAPAGKPVWMQLPAQGASSAGWRVFMADSRSTRCFRDEATLATATILGEQQTCELEAWLAREPADELKIVTTAAMLLPRVRIDCEEPLRLDNWQGYPASFHRMLAFICDAGIRNLVFLSGDAHLGCSACVSARNENSGASADFESHHAPALYAPYPFANETMWNLMLEDSFRFRWTDTKGTTSSYLCRVSATVTGDDRTGFGVLQARRAAGEWKVDVGFRIDALEPAGPQEMRTPCSAAM